MDGTVGDTPDLSRIVADPQQGHTTRELTEQSGFQQLAVGGVEIGRRFVQ